MILLIHWCFGVLMALAGLLFVLVHAAPRALVPFIGVPWAFHLRWAGALRYQAVLYRVFHTHELARISHLSLLWEQPLWFALLWLLHPLAVVAMGGLLLALAASLRAPRLAVALGVAWALAAGLGWGLVAALGSDTALWLSEALLVGGALLRMIGHAHEPFPPGMVDSRRFVPMGDAPLRFNTVVAPVAGVVSELAASLPFRLLVVEVLWLAERLSLAPARFGTRAEHQADAEHICRQGWAGSRVTEWMLPPKRDFISANEQARVATNESPRVSLGPRRQLL